MENSLKDDLFFFVTNMYSLHDEGYHSKSSFEDANELLMREMNEDTPYFSSQEDYENQWRKFEGLSEMMA